MADSGSYAGDITPQQAWEMLERDPSAVLIDCRTQAEWTYVGIPDLSPLGKDVVFAEWVTFPAGTSNGSFHDEVMVRVRDKDAPVLFLCRSGQRSKSAAIAMTAMGYSTCYNVAHGFEGDKDPEQHRGNMSGWKVDGLPWVQG